MLKKIIVLLFFTLFALATQAATLDEGVALFNQKLNTQAFSILSGYAADGNPKAQGLIARMYLNGWGVRRSPQEALDWASKGIDKNDPGSQLVLGELAYNNEMGLKRDKALFWILKAADQDYPAAFEALLRIYIKDPSKQSVDKYASSLEAQKSIMNTQLLLEIYSNQIYKPQVRLKVAKYSLMAVIEGRIKSSSYLIDIAKDIQMPKDIYTAWLKKAIDAGLTEYSDAYTDQIKDLSQSQINEITKVTTKELVNATSKYIKDRELKFGEIESADLIDEGWIQFVGQKRGIVNEPLAQYLLEEGLRLAIRTKDQHLIDEARSELGVVLGAAVNKNVRNPRLAEVHIAEGKQSDDHADNMIWYDYEKKVTLTKEEHNALLTSFKESEPLHQDHITTALGALPKELINNPSGIIDFLKIKYKEDPRPQIADHIADVIEDNNPTQNLVAARDWYQTYQDTEGTDAYDRLDRVNLILNGSYVKDTPDLRNAIDDLFDTSEKSNVTESVSLKSLKNVSSGKNLKLFALVIGNSSYKTAGLPNASNDSNAIALKLEKFGFNVTKLNNLNRKDFIKGLIEFSEKSKDADIAILFYSGHGMQLGGVNYLLPTDIDLNATSEIVASEGMSLNDILRRNILGKSRLVFLDACRTNPFKSTAKNAPSLGLAPVNTSSGTLISFAARDGGVAFDAANGKNSPYTTALVNNLDKEEDIGILLRSVRDEVLIATKGRQEPVEFGSLRGGQIILSKLAK
jgi:Caspase domain